MDVNGKFHGPAVLPSGEGTHRIEAFALCDVTQLMLIVVGRRFFELLSTQNT